MKYFIRITDGGHFTEENTFEITEKFHHEIKESVKSEMDKGRAKRV